MLSSTMLAQRTAILLVLVPALALAGCATDEPAGDRTLEEGFEKGTRNWETGADIPQDPNQPGEDVSWSIDASREVASSGSYSVNLTLDGGQGDGTIWLVRPLTVEAGQAYQANVSALAWSENASDNTLAHLVMHLGTERPIEEADFPDPGETTAEDPEADRGGLREALNQEEGWHEYAFGWNVPEDTNGTLWAAVGISVAWETEVTYFVDDIQIQLEPLGQSPSQTN